MAGAVGTVGVLSAIRAGRLRQAARIAPYVTGRRRPGPDPPSGRGPGPDGQAVRTQISFRPVSAGAVGV
ncbi:hypothetical protein GCM10009664_09630 [Kitasatospora gansuensis]